MCLPVCLVLSVDVTATHKVLKSVARAKCHCALPIRYFTCIKRKTVPNRERAALASRDEITTGVAQVGVDTQSGDHLLLSV